MIALGGLLVLMLPGLSAPSLEGSLLMVTAGMAWGFYSLRGRGRIDPIAATTDNFARSLPFVLALALLSLRALHMTPRGALLAIVSGAITSGLGYVVWYAALPTMTATRSAAVQLAVPVLAAFGGVLFLAEAPTLRLFTAALLILGGVALTAVGRGRMIRAVVKSKDESAHGRQ
jgi:drug/metabolite transporter (DMT)-like permease